MSIGSIAVIELDCIVESNELLFDSDIEDDALEFDAFVETDIVISGGSVNWYDGPYEFTPTVSEQIIDIANKTAIDNITINPIPNNYGLITWNGTTITVS